METFSVSFTLGKASAAHGANVAHNNRKYLADNVKPRETNHNINYRMQRVERAYQELFGEAVAEYNARQKRPCRRIQNYYEHIAEGNREEPYYEVIVQFGDCQTAPVGSHRGNIVSSMLDEYMQDFERRNPNLHVFNASMHRDEACPHLHIDFIPFYTKPRQRGLKKGVSMRAALVEQGFSPENAGKNQLEQWEESERKVLEAILHRHGYEREDKNAHHKHMEISEYKSMQDARRAAAALQKMERISDQELSSESVRAMKAELSIAKQTARRLEEEKYSPYRSFFYASDDKQMYVQQEMTRRGIPYREAENGFDAQDCYLKEIRAIEKSYRTPTVSYRDRLREDIDRMLLQSSSFQELLQHLPERGYRVRTGKYVAVKPFRGERYIRLKSLGEDYSELALQNRIRAKLRFEKNISDQLDSAKESQTPNLKVLLTVQFYMKSFVTASLPMRKRKPDKPFMWTNDPELDKLLALNDAINHGKTLNSIRADFQKLTEQETAVAEEMARLERVIKRNRELIECGEVVYNGKLSEAFTTREAWNLLTMYPDIRSDNFRKLELVIRDDSKKLQEVREQHDQIRQELQKTSDQLETAERVFGGTYVQQLVGENTRQRQTEYIPNGYYTADGMRR